MKPTLLPLSFLLHVLASCSPYTNHLPVTPADSPEASGITLKVGERRDIATRTGGSGINPVPTLGPAHYLSSSDTRVLAIEGKSFEATARAVAIAPGTADIRYTGEKSGRDGKITRVTVTP